MKKKIDICTEMSKMGMSAKNVVAKEFNKAVKMANDPWIHRSKGMLCETCMYFCNMRCRRHAPTMAGYPAVFKTDWCGDHKLDKSRMGGE